MNCDQTANIHAYHDGELPLVRRAAVERHLEACDDCRDLLADLRLTSQLVASAPLAAMPDDVMPRLQRAGWAQQQDRSLMRIASWMTAAAAAVLFAAIIWSPTQRGDNSNGIGSPNWTAILTPPAPVADDEPQDDEPRDDIIVAADWIASDLSQAVAERQ